MVRENRVAVDNVLKPLFISARITDWHFIVVAVGGVSASLNVLSGG